MSVGIPEVPGALRGVIPHSRDLLFGDMGSVVATKTFNGAWDAGRMTRAWRCSPLANSRRYGGITLTCLLDT